MAPEYYPTLPSTMLESHDLTVPSPRQMVPSPRRSPSPKRCRRDDGSGSSSRASFWDLDGSGKEARAESALGHLYSTVDADHFKGLDHEEEFRIMQQSWAEYSVRAVALAQRELMVAGLAKENYALVQEVNSLKEQVANLQSQLEEMTSLKKTAIVKKLRLTKEKNQIKEQLKMALEELESAKEKLASVEEQLRAAGATQQEVAKAWLQTPDDRAYVEEECVEANELGQETGVRRP